MTDTVNDRIMKIIQYYKLNKNSFSIKICENPQTIQNIVSGRLTKPSFDVLNSIVSTFVDINSDWLISGKGEMLKKKEETEINSEKIQYKNQEEKEYSDKVEELKANYQNKNDDKLFNIIAHDYGKNPLALLTEKIRLEGISEEEKIELESLFGEDKQKMIDLFNTAKQKQEDNIQKSKFESDIENRVLKLEFQMETVLKLLNEKINK